MTRSNTRRKLSSNLKSGLAAIEVVMATAMIIPSLLFLMYLGLRAMSAFLALVGTMIGSPLGVI